MKWKRIHFFIKEDKLVEDGEGKCKDSPTVLRFIAVQAVGRRSGSGLHFGGDREDKLE